MLSKVMILATAIAIATTTTTEAISVRQAVNDVLGADSELKMSCSTVGTVGCPSGSYMSQGCSSCYVTYSGYGKVGTLTCNCPSVSSLPNAFACDGAIQNVNGQLACVLPNSAQNNGYLQITSGGLPACTGCSVAANSQSSNVLNCQLCVNSAGSQFRSLTMYNPFSCSNGVAFQNNILMCGQNNPPPTPSPQNSAPECIGSYWPNVNRNGEKAPWKSCNYGQSNWYFESQVGCEQQNFCCWNAKTGMCQAPAGIPNCPTIGNANTCNNNTGGFCVWQPVSNCGAQGIPQKFCNQGGICSRICPGNENQLCPSG